MNWDDRREAFRPGQGGAYEKPFCPNPLHRTQAAGWCPTCDSEWDRTQDISEAEMAASCDQQEADWRGKLAAAEQRLAELKRQEPRDVVAIVEARRERNQMRENLLNLGHNWTPGGRKATKRDSY